MNDGRLEFPDRQLLFQDAILEFDREELTAKVQSLETVIFERLQETSQLGHDSREREALNLTVSVLRNFKRDRLGFPNWK